MPSFDALTPTHNRNEEIFSKKKSDKRDNTFKSIMLFRQEYYIEYPIELMWKTKMCLTSIWSRLHSAVVVVNSVDWKRNALNTDDTRHRITFQSSKYRNITSMSGPTTVTKSIHLCWNSFGNNCFPLFTRSPSKDQMVFFHYEQTYRLRRQKERNRKRWEENISNNRKRKRKKIVINLELDRFSGFHFALALALFSSSRSSVCLDKYNIVINHSDFCCHRTL